MFVAQPQVRATARATLNGMVDQGGILPFVEAEIFSDALTKDNPNLKAEVSEWL